MNNMYPLLLVRYGELGLKGRNKSQFIEALARNMERALRGLRPRRVSYTWGRLWVPLYDDMEEVLERLRKVFGIYSFSPVLQCEKEMGAISAAALRVLEDALPTGGIFKVETTRSDKTFPITSPEISKAAAGYIFSHTGDRYSADMRHPEKTVQIEVRAEGAYVYCDTIPGPKGLPVGTSSKALLMLSGGIDSPVAGWMALKRGVRVEAVYFHSHPFTSDRAKEKVLDLCRVLSEWAGEIRLHVVYFTDIQKAIRLNCPEDYGITIMRRMMFRICDRLAEQRKALALYTGECVGQVASQTLESMLTVNQVFSRPVLRPLVGFDKEEIIQISQRIGAYEISIRPYEDCCTVFVPVHPKIRPRPEEAARIEEALDIETLIAGALEKTESYSIRPERGRWEGEIREEEPEGKEGTPLADID